MHYVDMKGDGIVGDEDAFSVVERMPRNAVESHADLLNAIMQTAWTRNSGVRVKRLPWTVHGLSNILARRGYRLRTQRDYSLGYDKPRRLLWCEIILPAKPPQPKRTRLVQRRITL